MLLSPGQVFQHNLLNRQDHSSTTEGPQSQDMTYLGYSTASGALGGRGEGEDIVIGRPRGGELRGQVQIFDDRLTLLGNITGDQVGKLFILLTLN